MILDYYKYVHPAKIIKQPKVIKQPEEVAAGLPLVEDMVQITLAEFDVETKNYITAHHLKDYRRRQFTLSLLPVVHVMFDELLEGGDYWSEKLHA